MGTRICRLCELVPSRRLQCVSIEWRPLGAVEMRSKSIIRGSGLTLPTHIHQAEGVTKASTLTTVGIVQSLLQENYFATSTACPPPTPTNIWHCGRDCNCRSSSTSSVVSMLRNRHHADDEASQGLLFCSSLQEGLDVSVRQGHLSLNLHGRCSI